MAFNLGPVAAGKSATSKLGSRGPLPFLETSFSQSFHVIASLDETEQDVAQATGIPQIGGEYFEAICRGIKVDEGEPCFNPVIMAPGVLYTVTCDFDNSGDPDDASGLPPESQRPKVTWGGELEDVAIDRDVETGDPIVTGAGEKINASAPLPLPILSIKRWEFAPFEPLTILAYVGKRNSAPFYGAPVGTALMLPITSGDETVIDGTRYCEVSYQIKFRIEIDPDVVGGSWKENTWNGEALNQGHLYRETANGPPQRAVDKHGTPVKKNLRLNGTILPEGDPPTYIRFARNTAADFNNLNLGPYG